MNPLPIKPRRVLFPTFTIQSDPEPLLLWESDGGICLKLIPSTFENHCYYIILTELLGGRRSVEHIILLREWGWEAKRLSTDPYMTSINALEFVRHSIEVATIHSVMSV